MNFSASELNAIKQFAGGTLFSCVLHSDDYGSQIPEEHVLQFASLVSGDVVTVLMSS